MKYTIHTGLLGILSFFNESLSIFFIVATVMVM